MFFKKTLTYIGVCGTAGDPRGDHVVGELAGEDPAMPRGGSRGLPHQAGACVRCVAPLQPRQEFLDEDSSSLPGRQLTDRFSFSAR